MNPNSCFHVAWVELNRALETSDGFFPLSPTPLNETHQPGHTEIIGQSLAGDFELSQCAVIIPVSPIEILCTRKMRFTSVGIKANRRLDGSFCQRQPRGSMV